MRGETTTPSRTASPAAGTARTPRPRSRQRPGPREPPAMRPRRGPLQSPERSRRKTSPRDSKRRKMRVMASALAGNARRPRRRWARRSRRARQGRRAKSTRRATTRWCGAADVKRRNGPGEVTRRRGERGLLERGHHRQFLPGFEAYGEPRCIRARPTATTAASRVWRFHEARSARISARALS